ncbi:penicillin-binding protein activator [Pseudoalteromonas pernae]|uniref:penicillin-binding protein activator n=1 Tax=Pseudoalteromonas pernae TaxID=3118054 RepID=UPI0032425F03
MAIWKFKTVRLKTIAFMMLLSGLSACSTTQKPQENEISPISLNEPQEAESFSAQQIYAQAIELSAQSRVDMLIEAQTAAIDEQDWQTLELASSALMRVDPQRTTQSQLIIAYSQVQRGQLQSALSQAAKLQSQLSTAEEFYWHQLVQGAAYAKMGLYTQAIPFLFRASDASAEVTLGNQEVNPTLWQSLQSLSLSQLRALDQGSELQRGWSQLAQIKQLYLGSPIELHSATNNWQKQYPSHPANFALDEKVAQLMQVEPFSVSNLGVFLPLSGANKALGEAVKNGVLAALDNHQFENVYFIDANKTDDELRELISSASIDFAVGPLLKSNINRFEEQNLLEGVAAVYLNRSDIPRTSTEHFFFALAPEHELDQALQHFMAQGFKKPLLLAAGDRSGSRLTQHFSQQWLEYNEQAPLVGLFADNKEMETAITELLEVGNSAARIEVIESLFKQKVESETRSRRDIDVIYLLADATQTRLLKPYLDVNISTFVDRIPLYASSKSHSSQIDTSDKRDLNGLYFTELPWMLPPTGMTNLSSRQLKETVKSLWPNNADIEMRLFAMGFDAISVIPELRQLSMLPGKGMPGLTGTLSVNSDGELVRQLAWARYESRQITPVKLNHIKPTPLQREQETQEELSDVLATEDMAQQQAEGTAL